MMDISQHKEDYLGRRCIDCPHCSRDFPEHSCSNCYSEMEQDDCFKFEGYCSQDCKEYVEVVLPNRRKEKEEMGVKCQCDIEYCGKCFLSGCQDNNCPTHPLEKKLEFREKYSKR